MESGKNDRELRGFNCSLPDVSVGIIPGTAACRYLHNNIQCLIVSVYIVAR